MLTNLVAASQYYAVPVQIHLKVLVSPMTFIVSVDCRAQLTAKEEEIAALIIAKGTLETNLGEIRAEHEQLSAANAKVEADLAGVRQELAESQAAHSAAQVFFLCPLQRSSIMHAVRPEHNQVCHAGDLVHTRTS